MFSMRGIISNFLFSQALYLAVKEATKHDSLGNFILSASLSCTYQLASTLSGSFLTVLTPCVSNIINTDMLHPIRYAAGVYFSDGSSYLGWVSKL